MKKISHQQIGLFVLISFFLSTNLLWLYLNKAPPAWDQAAHIRSTVMARQWLAGDLKLTFPQLLNKFYAYPPLVYFIGAIWSFIFGLGVDQISFINTLFFISSLIGIYQLAKHLWSAKKAFMATLIFGFIPVIYNISRNFLLDLPLTAWFIWGVYFWFKSDYLRKGIETWFWWLMLIFASLTKINGLIYFAPMGVISLIRWVKTKNFKVFAKLTLGVAIWVSSVIWWWIINWESIHHYLTNLAGQGEPLTDPTNLFKFQTWIHYFKLFLLDQVQPIPAIIAVVCLVLWLTHLKEKTLPKEAKDLTWLLASIYIIFTLVKNKDFRFTIPLLPIIAIIMAVELDQLKKPLKNILLTALGIFWAIIFVNNSFGLINNYVISSPTFLFGDVQWLGLDDYPVQPARTRFWPNSQLTKTFYNSSLTQKKQQKILMIVNWAEINDNTLRLERDLMSAQGDSFFEFSSVRVNPEFENPDKIQEFISNFDLILTPEKDQPPAPFYSINLKSLEVVQNWVWNNQDKLNKGREFLLPNKTKIYLFEVRK